MGRRRFTLSTGHLVLSAWSVLAFCHLPTLIFSRVRRACFAAAGPERHRCCGPRCVQVLAGMVVGEFMYPVCAVWSFVLVLVVWSGVCFFFFSVAAVVL